MRERREGESASPRPEPKQRCRRRVVPGSEDIQRKRPIVQYVGQRMAAARSVGNERADRRERARLAGRGMGGEAAALYHVGLNP